MNKKLIYNIFKITLVLAIGVFLGLIARGILSPSINELGTNYYVEPNFEFDSFPSMVSEQGRITYYGAWRDTSSPKVKYSSSAIVDCRREATECTWVQVFPNASGNLYSELVYFPIRKWTSDRIIASTEGTCVDTVLTIDLVANSVTQEDSWHPSSSPEENCVAREGSSRSTFVLEDKEVSGFIKIRQAIINMF